MLLDNSLNYISNCSDNIEDAQWARIENNSFTVANRTPVLLKTGWRQTSPYDTYLEGVLQGSCELGCGAIAMAQILNYEGMFLVRRTHPTIL